MYVSARGQVESGPGERPSKRIRTHKSIDPEEAPDAHAKPPDPMKSLYKRYQKLQGFAVNTQLDLIDCNADPRSFQHLVKEVTEDVPDEEEVKKAFRVFLGVEEDDGIFLSENEDEVAEEKEGKVKMYEVKSVPGLFIYPSLLTPHIQLRLLDNLLHRDLSNPQHKTNVHLHYNVTYPSLDPNFGSPTSFFHPSAANLPYQPSSSHQPITTQSFLDKKLRWVTLGGQYDWTEKQYPSTPPPAFPPDIAQLISSLFPMTPEAAICNLYSPGDTLSLHRDVSETCAAPLASISIGCDAIFVVGLEGKDEKGRHRMAPLRLKSGDVVVMRGESRYAWHGVPKIVPGTCPKEIAEWPAIAGEEGGIFEHWRGWMKGKRVNLNVRQMFQGPEEVVQRDGTGEKS